MKLLVLILLPFNLLAQNLQWDANNEADLAGYRVYAGSNSGDYTLLQDVGRVNKFALLFNDGLGRFFTVTAYDYSGNESVYSAEVFWRAPAGNTPPLIEWGINDPVRFILEYDHFDTRGNPLEPEIELQSGLGTFSGLVYTANGDTLESSLAGYNIGENLRFRVRLVNQDNRSKVSEWAYTEETFVLIEQPQDLNGFPRQIKIFKLILK